MPPPDPPDAPVFELTLRAGPDPLTRHHPHLARDADYRLRLLLKDMLRGLGFTCVCCRRVDPTGPDHPPATVTQPDTATPSSPIVHRPRSAV